MTWHCSIFIISCIYYIFSTSIFIFPYNRAISNYPMSICSNRIRNDIRKRNQISATCCIIPSIECMAFSCRLQYITRIKDISTLSSDYKMICFFEIYCEYSSICIKNIFYFTFWNPFSIQCSYTWSYFVSIFYLCSESAITIPSSELKTTLGRIC